MRGSRLARVARHPLGHFLALGAGLWWVLAQVETPTVVVRAADLADVRTQWIRETGRVPTDAEWQAGRARAIDEELMVREALRLRLDRHDVVVRERLLTNLEFLDPTTAASTDAQARLEQARRLDMPARDPVTRRRLVQLMEARFAGAGTLTSTDLDEFLRRHADRYAQPERRAFRQVFFARDARGDHTHADATAALARLTTDANAGVAGDPFLAGDTFAPMDRRAVASRLGEDVARAVSSAPAGHWIGPVASVWGEHLLRVERVEPAGTVPLDTVRSQVAYAALDEREQANVRAGLAGLRQRWKVEVTGS